MDKLLIITGPTATGKTNLAFELADKISGEILSADSRQVYEKLNIGTGKDLPEKCVKKESVIIWANKKIPYYEINNVRLWGYDLTTPYEEFSVAQYLEIAKKIIKEITANKKLPIVVGGTGLYLKAITKGIETAIIPPNNLLRKSLENNSVDYLFNKLKEIDFKKADALNPSDKKNPRRLIRAIEIAKWKKENPLIYKNVENTNLDILKIGLTADKDVLYKNIESRVQRRLQQGLINEIKSLLNDKLDWTYQSMNTLSYKEWQDYFKGNKTSDEVIKEWIDDEKHYIKRQLTWFKKDKDIHWFNIKDRDYKENIDKYIREWYSQ